MDRKLKISILFTRMIKCDREFTQNSMMICVQKGKLAKIGHISLIMYYIHFVLHFDVN